MIKANNLKIGGEIRVIAPSRSLSVVRENVMNQAISYLQDKGFKVTFSSNSREIDETKSSSIQSRVNDLHEAFLDSNVGAILTCIGGFNVNQILEYIDYSIIKNNPKPLCGYSDITALVNAVYAKTGLITYHGAHFSTFGFSEGIDYTYDYFEKCLISTDSYSINPSHQSETYYVIQEGSCEGEIVGGNLCTLNLLQGTEFMPDLSGKVVFIEDDNIMGDYFKFEFERNLQSLIQSKGFEGVKGVVFGRFHEDCKMNLDTIKRIVSTKKQLKDIPVIFNVDFGHVRPIATFPIGGLVRLEAYGNNISLNIINH